MRALAAVLALSGCAEAVADVRQREVVVDTERVAPLAVTDERVERALLQMRDGSYVEVAGAHLVREGKMLHVTAIDHEPWSGDIDDIAALELQQVRVEGNRVRVQADDAGPTIVVILGGVAIMFFTAVLVFE